MYLVHATRHPSPACEDDLCPFSFALLAPTYARQSDPTYPHSLTLTLSPSPSHPLHHPTTLYSPYHPITLTLTPPDPPHTP